MIKQSKQFQITNENLSPFSLLKEKSSSSNSKRKLFSICNADNTPLDIIPKTSKPFEDNFTKVQPKLKKFPKIESVPLIKIHDTEEEHILDFDKIMEILLPRAIKKPIIPKKKHSKKLETFLKRKTVKSSKIKNSNFKKDKTKTKTNDLYSINNFISNTLKIVEKKEFFNIECPTFKENYFFPNEQSEMTVDINIDELESEVEDISDQRYKNYHDKYEENEREYRIKLNEEYMKKQKKRVTSTNENIESNPLIIKISLDQYRMSD